jgi:DNA-binding PadR family transcriptional regulator
MFRRGEFYGYDIHKKLGQNNVKVELSRLYRVLNEMESESLLNSRWANSTSGPNKKMYSVGEEGKKELRKILLQAIETVHDFYGDYLISLYPEIRVFDEMFDWFTQGLKGDERIAYLVTNNSPLNETVFRNLTQRIPQGKFHIIATPNVTRQSNFDSRTPMKGAYNDIPFKDGFFDMVYVIGLPPWAIMEEALTELYRTLKENGKVGFLTPSVLLQDLANPITIGDYIEKHEHEDIEQGEHLDKELLTKIINEKFRETKEKELVHITMLMLYR